VSNAFFAHPTAVVDPGCVIGSGSKVWHFVHISSGAHIGENVSIGQNVFVANGVKIGPGCKIQNNVSLYEGVVLEANVFCGPSVVFTIHAPLWKEKMSIEKHWYEKERL
jgi:UDP-2-acetamido-3-amino-2,3-dideoxy-glucuronate N-acetyltransferase